MKRGKPDPILLEVINSIEDRTDLTWCQKIDEILKFKKTRGLKGFHCSAYPSADKQSSTEELAKGLFQMMKLEAQGEFYSYEGDELT